MADNEKWQTTPNGVRFECPKCGEKYYQNSWREGLPMYCHIYSSFTLESQDRLIGNSCCDEEFKKTTFLWSYEEK